MAQEKRGEKLRFYYCYKIREAPPFLKGGWEGLMFK